MDKILKERVKRYRIVPFAQALHIVVTNDVRLSLAKREKLFTVEVSDIMYAVTILPAGSTHIYMFLPEDCKPATIVHESVHVVAGMMRANGAEFEEEVWAYHMDELFTVIAKFLYKEKKHGNK